jgi:hypothetical protein
MGSLDSDPSTPLRFARDDEGVLLRSRPGFVTAVQDCVVKIGRVRFACIEGDDHALVLEIHFYIVHAFNFHKRPTQLSHSLMVILAFGGYFDCFHDRVVGAFREKGIGWIRIAWSCRVHRFLILLI